MVIKPPTCSMRLMFDTRLLALLSMASMQSEKELIYSTHTHKYILFCLSRFSVLIRSRRPLLFLIIKTF